MVLVDTLVCIDHLRVADALLVGLLRGSQVMTHDFVIGELALGRLSQRGVVLDALRGLPRAVVARDDEVMHFIDSNGLHGIGIGYVDAHLLAAARLTQDGAIWTRDRRLAAAADRLLLCVKDR